MPRDSKGNFFNSTQRAMANDKAIAAPKQAPAMSAGAGEMEEGHSSVVEPLREAINAWLDEEASMERHAPDTIEALREAWNAFLDEEAA